jgi:hypothetical protein
LKCSEARGFNYDGSWGTSALDLWQHHDHGTMAVEIARGKRYFPKWNVCRWWMSEGSFQRNPERFLANFEAGLSIFAQHGILVVPLLFNRWRDPVCDFGGVSLEHIVPGLSNMSGRAEDLFAHAEADWPREPAQIERTHLAYLEAVVGDHQDDPRIFCWDLCNEPLMAPYFDDPTDPIRAAEFQWLSWCYKTCKRLGATQPLTIGNYPSRQHLEFTEPISDVLSFHPYYVWNVPVRDAVEWETGLDADKIKYESMLDDCLSFAQSKGKGLLASETVWGAAEDAKRVEVMRYTLGALCKRGIGFTVHALQHSLVADLHYAAYGPVGPPEVLHFVNPDGSLRKGHEAFNEFC